MLNYFKLEKENEKKNKGSFRVPLSSRFYITPKIEYNNKIAWNFYSWMKYDFFINNWIYHIVKENERLDLISYKYYNSNKYWWIIALFNSDISLDPYELEKPGIKLRIPERDEIVTFMDRFASDQDKIYKDSERVIY